MIRVDENDDRFYVKASTIEGAGQGLFAKVDIPKGGFLEVIGVQVRRHATADSCTRFADAYKFLSSDPEYAVIPLGWGALVNHAPKKEQQNAEIRNVKAKVTGKQRKRLRSDFFHYSGEVVYRFTRDIRRDEEILGDYGRGFRHRMDTLGKAAADVDDAAWEELRRMGLYNLQLIDRMLRAEEPAPKLLVLPG